MQQLRNLWISVSMRRVCSKVINLETNMIHRLLISDYFDRVFGTLHGTTPIWYGNAIDLCTSHPSNVAQTSSPVAGDLVVFNVGTYGHVAVITSKSSTSVNVVEQNAATTGTNTYSTSSVKCYLHYTGSSPPPPPPPPSG